MSKKVSLIFISLVLFASFLTGCGGGQPAAPAPAPAAEAPAASAPAAPAADSGMAGKKVAILTIRKLTTPADLDTVKGIDKLAAEGVETKIIECTEISEYKEQIQAAAEGGYDVVYFIYDNFLEAVQELAPSYPDTEFIGLWIDLDPAKAQKNIKPLFFRPEQGSFMCGVAAALTSETKKVGFIGGGINPGIITFLAGYEAGIKYVDNGTELVVSWANTFDDPLKGKELANSLFERDVDVVFQVANQTGLGVIEAAKEKGKFAIGVDVDQSPLAPEAVIASCLLDHGYATYDSVSNALKGNFTNDQVYYGLAEGTPVIALNSNLVSSDIQKQISEIQDKIAAGEITIPKTTDTQ